MPVQSQHPSTVFMADLRNRSRAVPLARDNRSNVASAPGVPVALADGNFQIQRNVNGAGVLLALADGNCQLQRNVNAAAAGNMFPVYAPASGLNFGKQQVLNGAVNDPESEQNCNISGSRKRAREEAIQLTQQRRQMSQLLGLSELQPKNSAAIPVPVPVAGAVTVSQSSSPSALNTNPLPLISYLGVADDMATLFQQQQEEDDQVVRLHTGKIRLALEDKRQRHWRALVMTLHEGIMKKMNEKEVELHKLSRKNAELEEQVKHFAKESEIWQNKEAELHILSRENVELQERVVHFAKKSEIRQNKEAELHKLSLKNAELEERVQHFAKESEILRSNLEHVAAHSREQSKEGHGDNEAEDAQSYFRDGEVADIHSSTMKEFMELKEQRTCRVCKISSSYILLLPCRHLCVCKDCDSSLEICPLCQSVKNASIQVYLW